MVVRVRARRNGEDDQEDSELRAALESSPIVPGRGGAGGGGGGRHGLLWLFQLFLGSHAVVAPQTILPPGLSWSLGAVPRDSQGQSRAPQDKLLPFPLHSVHLVWSGIAAAPQGLSQASQAHLAFPQCWWPRL